MTDLTRRHLEKSLAEAGLNRFAVLDLHTLPEALRTSIAAITPIEGFNRLLLIGHGGKALWSQVNASENPSDNPIDDHSVATLSACLDTHLPEARWQLLYPGDAPIGLQHLGEQAGWHHPSPFRIGICRQWGTWSAYRAVALIKADLAPTAPEEDRSPCDDCKDKPCISACPASAMDSGVFEPERCFAHRLGDGSDCASTCLARTACPVASQHMYDADQIRYHYDRSLATLRKYY